MSRSIFDDQEMFMKSCGQTVGHKNTAQFNLYYTLIHEELAELQEAVKAGDEVEIFDALIDMIVVLTGAGLSAGFPMREGWDAVWLSNMRKIDPESGTVQYREDGKILKPAGWRAPQLKKILGEVTDHANQPQTQGDRS